VSKVRTTITLDEELLKEVTELAEEKERSVSQQIVYFIKMCLKKEREGKGEK
jgi:metal-responsive CopG/Arc/MetJ family transcriptional regulator